MKAISYGNTYEIHDDTLKTYDRLPAQTYIVRFNKMSGFYLEKYSDIAIKEEKIYGAHQEKVEKALKTFAGFDRNLGVILSGNKGIGKSLFAKLLAAEAIKRGLPLIVIDSFIPGIASYIESIDQEVVVLFDEFDKTFGNIKTSENEADPQAGLLSLFDGIAQGKKLFVITCNELRHLNDYLINRPGRFHYHFRFDYPSDAEVRAYLEDKISTGYYDEITKVISFSKRVPLNYDCLRSIAYELNNGEAFETAIQDLNIINMSSEKYNLALHYEENFVMTAKGIYMDLFGGDDDTRVYLCDSKGNNLVDIDFNPQDCIYDVGRGLNTIPANKIKFNYDNDYEELTEKVKALKPTYLTIQRCKEKRLHYAI